MKRSNKGIEWFVWSNPFAKAALLEIKTTNSNIDTFLTFNTWCTLKGKVRCTDGIKRLVGHAMFDKINEEWGK